MAGPAAAWDLTNLHPQGGVSQCIVCCCARAASGHATAAAPSSFTHPRAAQIQKERNKSQHNFVRTIH
jgi:hypothetical protein